jgi:hypothetical protein
VSDIYYFDVVDVVAFIYCYALVVIIGYVVELDADVTNQAESRKEDVFFCTFADDYVLQIIVVPSCYVSEVGRFVGVVALDINLVEPSEE